MQTKPTDLRLAHEVAKRLNGNRHCPFYRQVRFDSTGMARLLVSDLCRQGAADLGTSLVGLAKVGLSFDTPKSPDWLAMTVVAVITTLQDKAPELLAEDRMLTPPPDGTKETVTMLVGLAVAIAYRMVLIGEEVPSDRTKARLATAARETLDGTAKSCGTASSRRRLIGSFVRRFFDDMPDLKRIDGLPAELLEKLSASAYGPPTGPATSAPRPPARLPLKERREAAVKLLRDPEVAALSDREVGRRSGLHEKTVKVLRQRMYGDEPHVRKVSRKGTSYFTSTSKTRKTSG